jgi:hypothetical protein
MEKESNFLDFFNKKQKPTQENEVISFWKTSIQPFSKELENIINELSPLRNQGSEFRSLFEKVKNSYYELAQLRQEVITAIKTSGKKGNIKTSNNQTIDNYKKKVITIYLAIIDQINEMSNLTQNETLLKNFYLYKKKLRTIIDLLKVQNPAYGKEKPNDPSVTEKTKRPSVK